MALIQHSDFADDSWIRLDDASEAPIGAKIIVSLERWQRDRESLLGRNAPVGVLLKSNQPPALIATDIDRLSLIALEFPKFTDGRAYSYARLLRERHGFKGELRAVGNILRDQLFFMRRVGFDAFEVPDRARAQEWLKSFGDFDVVYQETGDGRRRPVRVREPEIGG